MGAEMKINISAWLPIIRSNYSKMQELESE